MPEYLYSMKYFITDLIELPSESYDKIDFE